MENRFTAIVVAFASGCFFGFWQESFFAGCFMFFALTVLAVHATIE